MTETRNWDVDWVKAKRDAAVATVMAAIPDRNLRRGRVGMESSGVRTVVPNLSLVGNEWVGGVAWRRERPLMVVASKTTRRAKVAMEMAEAREGEALAILPPWMERTARNILR